MGTNYYYTKFARCEKCRNVIQEDIHIGKSSRGWKFHFQYESFENHAEWKEELKNKYIFDNYQNEINYNQFIELIERKQETIQPSISNKKNYFLINGYNFFKGVWS